MSTWVGICIFIFLLLAFALGIRSTYYARPKKLWLKYANCLPHLDENPSVEVLRAINATVGDIGYSRFLGVPEQSRGFHLWVDLTIGVRALHLTISEPVNLQNLPPLSIPWGRIESARGIGNEWGKSGFGLRIHDMPPEMDSNHGTDFLIWFGAPVEKIQPLLQAIDALATSKR